MFANCRKALSLSHLRVEAGAEGVGASHIFGVFFLILILILISLLIRNLKDEIEIKIKIKIKSKSKIKRGSLEFGCATEEGNWVFWR
jgi:hypothetical protein